MLKHPEELLQCSQNSAINHVTVAQTTEQTNTKTRYFSIHTSKRHGENRTYSMRAQAHHPPPPFPIHKSNFFWAEASSTFCGCSQVPTEFLVRYRFFGGNKLQLHVLSNSCLPNPSASFIARHYSPRFLTASARALRLVGCTVVARSSRASRGPFIFFHRQIREKFPVLGQLRNNQYDYARRLYQRLCDCEHACGE